MVIVETSIFTGRVLKLLSDDEYRELQSLLIQRPDAGKIIVGSSGIRKLRWAAKGKGKRGGARVIYYWAAAQDKILMLIIYVKSEQDDLSPEQIKILQKIIKEEYP